MVSSNEAGFNLRKTPSLQRNILHSHRMEIISRADGFTGQRPIPKQIIELRGCRSWSVSCASPKVDTGHLNYPVSGRDSAKSGSGCMDNRHLSCLAESNIVNVGDSQPDEKVSSPPMTDVRVGAVIVVGARESRVHAEHRCRCFAGEGPQPTGIVELSKRLKAWESLPIPPKSES